MSALLCYFHIFYCYTLQCCSSVNSSENGVFCARGVNGMHAMGLPLHFCSSTTNAMPFSATLPCSAGVQVITWVGGSSKLPRPVESKLFSTVFKNLQLPQASSIHHHRIALNHHLPDFSPLRGEKFKCYHWRQVTQSRSGEGGGGGEGKEGEEEEEGVCPTFCPRFFSAVFASNLFIVRPRSVLGARSA